MFDFDAEIGKDIVHGFSIALPSVDLNKHLYVVGQTGTGKSTLFENIFYDVIKARAGGMFLDPHGDSYQTILNMIPKDRVNDTMLIDLIDPDYQIVYNPIADVPKRHIARVTLNTVSTLMHVMGLNPETTPRIVSNLENSIYALTEAKRQSIGDIPAFLEDKEYRIEILRKVTHPGVKRYWAQFNKLSTQKQFERTESTLTRISTLLLHPVMEQVFCKPYNKVNLRQIMDQQKLVVVNLSKSLVGEEVARLFGGFLMHDTFLSALGRAEMKPYLRRPFYVCADEFPIYGVGGGTLKDTLSEVRKYNLSLVLGHQYTGQVDKEIMDAIFGNVGSLVSFRVGHNDALEICNTMECNEQTLTDLGKYRARVRLLRDNDTTNAVTVKTNPPISKNEKTMVSIRKQSHERYCAMTPEYQEQLQKQHLVKLGELQKEVSAGVK